MSVEQTLQERHQAYLALVECAQFDRDYRNSLIRRAHQSGIPVTEIAAILHMNRGHISDIANGTEPGRAASPSEGEQPAQTSKG